MCLGSFWRSTHVRTRDNNASLAYDTCTLYSDKTGAASSHVRTNDITMHVVVTRWRQSAGYFETLCSKTLTVLSAVDTSLPFVRFTATA